VTIQCPQSAWKAGSVSLARSGSDEHALGFGRAQSVERLDGGAQGEEQRQLVPLAIGALGEQGDDSQSPLQVADGVRVG
jgi:hypothetical protein